MSLSDDDLLNNASPETRQRYEDALARRRSKERGFQRVSPFAVARRVESPVPVERVSEEQAWVHEVPVVSERVGEDRAGVYEVPAAPEGGSKKEAWAHWEYSPEEWALFERVDWRPISFRFWLFAGLSLLFLFDIGMLVWSSTSGHYLLLTLSVVLMVAWVPILMIFAIYIDIYDEAVKRHRVRQREKHAHKVTFDGKGLWEAGTYFPLNDQLFSLEKVSMTSDTKLHSESGQGFLMYFVACLLTCTKPLSLRRIAPLSADWYEPLVIHFSRTRYGGRRTTPHSYPLHVLVPGGCEQEAADLVRRFQTEVIQARKEALERWRNPPEPLS